VYTVKLASAITLGGAYDWAEMWRAQSASLSWSGSLVIN